MTKKKEITAFLIVAVSVVAIVGGAAALFPETAAAHPVAFLLAGALLIVSAISMMLLRLYYRNQKMLADAQHELEKSKLREEMDFVLRGISGGVLIAREDADKSVVYISEPLATLFGYTVDEFLTAGTNKSAGIVYEEDLPLLEEELPEGETSTLRFRVRCKDGSLKWMSSCGKVVINERGERLRYSFNHDITQLMETHQKAEELTALLRQERSLYRDAMLHNCDYAYIVNVDENRFHDVYKGDFLTHYLFDASQPYDEVMARVVERMKPVILHNRQEIHLTAHYAAAYDQGQRIVEVEYYAPDADVYKRKTLFLSKSEEGVLYAFIVAHDITARMKEELRVQVALAELAEKAKQVGGGNLDVTFDIDAPGPIGVLSDVLSQTVLNLKWHTEKLRSQAIQDPMTGVKNKRAWQDAEVRLDEEIQAGGAEFAVVVCDINGLKQVNDTIGHEAGDSLIIRSCRHICRTFKHSPVYRIGGDEFTVILQGADLANCDSLLETFHTGMANQVLEYPDQPPFSVALGIAHYTADDATFSDVFQRADKAMYMKKVTMKQSTARDTVSESATGDK